MGVLPSALDETDVRQWVLSAVRNAHDDALTVAEITQEVRQRANHEIERGHIESAVAELLDRERLEVHDRDASPTRYRVPPE